MSIKEWDIPLEELKVGDKIGSGRFSTVHAGNWHGDVAIKFLDMENADDEAALEAFRLDVATFRLEVPCERLVIKPICLQENSS